MNLSVDEFIRYLINGGSTAFFTIKSGSTTFSWEDIEKKLQACSDYLQARKDSLSDDGKKADSALKTIEDTRNLLAGVSAYMPNMNTDCNLMEMLDNLVRRNNEESFRITQVTDLPRFYWLYAN
ncbi:MAG: hypothetical protein GY793_07160 [Proteobacteria bacterium]|nr:hypothetical protein [Pseudomonadota bacterium]